MSKIDEQMVVDKINSHFGFNFVLADDPYSPYDAKDRAYIMEIKVRGKFHGDIMIEEIKFLKLFELYEKEGYIPFIMQVSDGVYRYVSILSDYEIITKRAKKTTDFSDNQYTEKRFCVFKKFRELGKL